MRTRMLCGRTYNVFPFTIVGFLGAFAAAYGQEPPGRPAAEAAIPEAAPSGVYINDSFEAADAITKAQKLISARQWTEAADLLQRTADSMGKKLIRTSSQSYVGVRQHVNDLIADWPHAGISAYRDLFEAEASRLLTEAAATPQLDDDLLLLDRYFCTAAAARHADVVGQRAIESANLALAERMYRRILEHHPDAAAHNSRYRAMLAIVAAMRGESGTVGTLEPDFRVRWMGEERRIGEILEQWRASVGSLEDTTATRDWPIFQGQADRNRLGSCNIDDLGLLWRFDSVPRSERGATGGGSQRKSRDGQPPVNQASSIFPIISGDFILLQRARDIIALHRNSGVVAWRYQDPNVNAAVAADDGDQSAGWDCVTVQDGRVYAYLPGSASPSYGYESARTPPELICLDASTGRTIWSADPQVFTEDVSEIGFDSSPLVDHGHLYIIGRRRRSFGFEDCYLYRFNAINGAFEHRTHLGSATTGTFGARRATLAFPTLQSDCVYVCTNLGTIAAVSAHTGTVRWLRLYEREAGGTSLDANWTIRTIDPWAFNPVIWSAGKLFVRPLDATAVIILNAEDGQIVRSIPAAELGGAASIVGVHDDVLCAVGDAVTCYDLTAGVARWSSPVPEASPLAGRPQWVEGSLLVPTTVGISIYQVSDGNRRDVLWDTDGRSGNLLALPEQLIVAGDQVVAAYVRKQDLWNSLRNRMMDAAEAPVPALEFAEVALRGGDDAQALTLLAEAVRRAGEFLRPLDAQLQHRLFNDTLLFADTLAARGLLSLDHLTQLFSYASQCPPDAEAHVGYRFRFGQLFDQAQQGEQAMRLYHQVLRDRSLRELSVPRSGTELASPETAGAAAQTRIAGLIERYGHAIYAPYEAEAQSWLESGRSTNDIAMLARVAETFPNSDAAPLALMAQGEALFAVRKYAESARVLSRAYQRYPQKVNRAELMRRLADAYERAGKHHAAYRWLTKAAREYPRMLIDFAGRRVTFREYRDQLPGLRADLEVRRPRIDLPLNRHDLQPLGEGSMLLVPRFSEAPTQDWSRYYVYSPAGIRAFAGRTNVELWSAPVTVRANAELLVATTRVAVFATAYEVFAVDVPTGLRIWSHAEYPAKLDDPNADWEQTGSFRTHALQDDVLVSVRDNGNMLCLAIGTGEVHWTWTHPPAPLGRVRLCDPWLVYGIVQDGRTVLRHHDAATGALVGTIPTDETRPLEDLLVTFDGQVITVTSQSVSAYDIDTAARRWQVSLDGQLRQTSVFLDLDALYFSDDGKVIRKMSLEDGRTLWRSEALSLRSDDQLAQARIEGSIVASTSVAVAAVDEVTGVTLWKGSIPEGVRFVRSILTESYVAAVHIPEEAQQLESVAYFYDHRNASGVIPSPGGATPLGHLADVRAIMAVDGGLLIQTGSNLQSWASD